MFGEEYSSSVKKRYNPSVFVFTCFTVGFASCFIIEGLIIEERDGRRDRVLRFLLNVVATEDRLLIESFDRLYYSFVF